MLTVDPHRMMAHGAATHRVSRVYYGDRNYRPNEWNVLADLDGPGVVTHLWIHGEGIGHHWAAGYGCVAAELRAWAGIAGPAGRGVRLIAMEHA